MTSTNYQVGLNEMDPIKESGLVFNFQIVQSTISTNHPPEVELTISNQGSASHTLSFFDEGQIGVTQNPEPAMVMVSEYYDMSQLSIEDGIYLTDQISVAAKPRHIILQPGEIATSKLYILIANRRTPLTLGKYIFKLEYRIDGEKVPINAPVVVQQQE